MTCTFFGHRNTPDWIAPILRATLVNLVENRGATRFYVGNNGRFDAMVKAELGRLKSVYPHMDYAVVLAYLPTSPQLDDAPTLYPEGLETVSTRFAISKRNGWMLQQADFVVTYVRSPGGAANFKEMALRMGKIVVELADMD